MEVPMAKLLSGKEVTASLNEEIRKKTELLTAHHITPKLGIIRIGEREDDISYERGATKRCETLGVSYEKFLLPEDASEEMVLNTIAQVNEADDIHGVLLFRPLPRHLDENKIINALAVEKDIDGITDRSMASVFLGKQTGFAPCTPSACMKILDRLLRQKSCRDRQKSRRWKTSRHDAASEKCNRNYLSHENYRYAIRCKRSRHRDRCCRESRCHRRKISACRSDCH
jgi:hypothetical protein